MTPVIERLRRATGSSAAAALYHTPWYLLAGDAGGAAALLTAGCEQGDLRGTLDRQGWGWWLLPHLVGIALGDGLVPEAEDHEAEVVVETALDLLRRQRRHLPLNGIVLVADASLVQSPGAARARGNALRRLLGTACRALKRDFPVHLVVTGLEALPGHAAFFNALPAGVAEQALGHLQDPPSPMAEPEAVLSAAYEAMLDRVERVRLGLLLDVSDESRDRAGVFRFVEGLAGLEPGLLAFGRALFARDGFSQGPAACWRSLFLTAPGAPAKERHVADLLSRFLPQDAGLLRAD